MSTANIIHGDCIEVLGTLPEKHFHCCVTSPPYFGLRSYLPADHPDKDREIGSESTPDEFVATMVAVFRGVWRVLRHDGCCWLNLGDSYATGGGKCKNPGGDERVGEVGFLPRGETPANRLKLPGLKPKDLCGIPWRVAFALQADGWYLRDAVIWHKPSPMPSSQRDRCTSSYEFIFQLTKGPRYYFDIEAIKEPSKPESFARQLAGYKKTERDTHNHYRDGFQRGPGYESVIATPRNVWKITNDGYKGEHYATFPVELPTRCIKASTSAKGCCPTCGAPWTRIVDRTAVTRERPNELTKRTGADGTGNHCANTVAGVESRTLGWETTCGCEWPAAPPAIVPCRVIDPFSGAGTTAIACRRLGVDYSGIDLDARAIEQTHARLRKEANRGGKMQPVKVAEGQQELFG